MEESVVARRRAGDAIVLSIKEGRFDYIDVVGVHLAGDRRISSESAAIASAGGIRSPPATRPLGIQLVPALDVRIG